MTAPSYPSPEIRIGDDQSLAVDLDLALEVVDQRFIKMAPAFFEACIALRILDDAQVRKFDEGCRDLRAPPGA